MWRSRAALLIAASWMAVLVISGVVSARLFALSPKGMVDHADAIVVAEVIAKEQTPGDTGVAPIVEYKLRVERVLKGQLSGNELAITVTPLLWSSVAPAEMLPDPGTKVFLLLRQDGGWRLAADLNAVAIRPRPVKWCKMRSPSGFGPHIAAFTKALIGSPPGASPLVAAA